VVTHILQVYAEGLVLRLKAYKEYRIDTWLRLVTRLVRFGAQLAFIGVAFSFVQDLGGWTLWQVILMWTVGMTGRYLLEGLFSFANTAKLYFFEGGLDYYLIRPLPIFPYASAENLQVEEVLNALLFVGIGVLACAKLGVLDQPLVLVFLAIGVLSSLLVWLGIAFTISCCAVWLGSVSAIWQGLSAMYENAKYPLDILPLPLRVFLTVLPFGFTAYYPVAFALRIHDNVWRGFISLAVGVAAAGLAFSVYSLALRKYGSSGTAAG
jgi:ABC-2 type transport system permease protein